VIGRETVIRDALARLRVEPNQVIELRALNVPQRYGKPKTVAGWFDDLDKLAAAAVQLEERGATGVYTTLNIVSPALLARACNRLDEHPKALTCDADILRRVWLPRVPQLNSERRFYFRRAMLASAGRRRFRAAPIRPVHVERCRVKSSNTSRSSDPGLRVAA